jgi:hypothetical protein
MRPISGFQLVAAFSPQTAWRAIAVVMFVLAESAASAQSTGSLGGGPPDTTARLAGPPVHPGVATLVPELRIGTVGGEANYLFGRVSDIAVGPDGSIYVLDNSIPSLRQFDGAGKYMRTFGRKGQGPGEYASPGGIAVHPDGRVLMWDTGNWRVNVYSPSGEPADHWAIPSGMRGSAFTTRAIMTDVQGSVLVRRNRLTAMVLSEVFWIRMRADGSLVDTIVQPEASVSYPEIVVRGETGGTSMRIPFAPEMLWLWSPRGYLVTSFTANYAIDLRIPGANPGETPLTWRDGHPVTSIRRDVRPVPVTSAERASERRSIEEHARSINPSWTWNVPAIPRSKPFIDGMIIAGDGRIWVRLPAEVPYALPSPTLTEVRRKAAAASAAAAAAGERAPRVPGPPEPIEYDVFEPDGTFLGQVETPANVSTFVRIGDLVYGVTYDEDDVPFVTRFRIAWK